MDPNLFKFFICLNSIISGLGSYMDELNKSEYLPWKKNIYIYIYIDDDKIVNQDAHPEGL